ncbi:hypothetical protein [Variovorax sp. YR752]|uniref:hypothetical protein n=1 Tax=Variovorax sp. YR752 TaxID=1884383 RepID=UPI0031377C3C
MNPGAARFATLTRAGVACTVYTLLVAAAFSAWHLAIGSTPMALALVICFLPAALCFACACSSQHDRRQYVARLMAAALMAPILLLFWSIDGPTHAGLGMALAIGFVLLHVAAFLLGLRWLAAFSTRIDPAAGTPVASTAMLVQRLIALPSLGLPLDVHADPTHHTLQFGWNPTGQARRRHRVTLHLQTDAAQVQVLEQLQADGAAPADTREASMRSPGDAFFDPTRPDAQKVWLRTVQSTILDVEHLAGAPVALVGDALAWRGPAARVLPDTDTLMACLANIVVQSGWSWAPRLRG